MTSSGRPRQPQVDGTTQVKLPHEYGVCDLSSSRESHGSAVCLSGPFDSRVALSLVFLEGKFKIGNVSVDLQVLVWFWGADATDFSKQIVHWPCLFRMDVRTLCGSLRKVSFED